MFDFCLDCHTWHREASLCHIDVEESSESLVFFLPAVSYRNLKQSWQTSIHCSSTRSGVMNRWVGHRPRHWEFSRMSNHFSQVHVCPVIFDLRVNVPFPFPFPFICCFSIKKREEKKRKELWNIVTTIVARKLLDVALFPGSSVREWNNRKKKEGEPWDIFTCDKPHW